MAGDAGRGGRGTSPNEDGSDIQAAARESGTSGTMKRGKYVSVACEGCKRRKIKCNGETPCVRCGKLLLECVYARNRLLDAVEDSSESGQQKTEPSTVQEEENELLAPSTSTEMAEAGNMQSDLQSDALSQIPPSTFAPKDRPLQVQIFRFRGPTSSAFSLDLAKYSLLTAGISGPHCCTEFSALDTYQPTQWHKDPLWYITKSEALRLVKLYEDECGSMYPILDIQTIKEHVNIIYTFMELTAPKILETNLASVKFSSHIDNDILKIILATALISEGKGQSQLGQRLFEDVQEGERDVLWVNTSMIDIKRLKIIVIMAIYQFQRDEEHLAWRKLGQAARLCIEFGLHRRERLAVLFQTEPELQWTLRLFWSIYVLDRRWSFGCGLNFAICESDIDPKLPEPDASVPYLVSMVRYARISSWIWTYVSTYSITPDDQYDIDSLEFQLLKWKENIPSNLQVYHHEIRNQDRTLRRLRALLFLRFNEMRILIYRPILRSHASVMQRLDHAQEVVGIAKETILFLVHLDQTSDIYRASEVCFNHFLFSALSVIFLAVSNAQRQFGAQCSTEFYMALGLIRTLSGQSYVSRRLWESIKCLADLGPKLGLVSRGSNDHTENPPLPPNVALSEASALPGAENSSGFAYSDFAQFK